MGPVLASVTEKTITGISVRTNNKLESNPQKAVLPSFWDHFFENDLLEQIPGKIPDSPIYGVYSDYNSKKKGTYTVTAGVEAYNLDRGIGDFETIKIEAGNYLMFKGNGPMPDIVAETWQNVWNYFSKMSEFKRVFRTDFEVYSSQEQVEVYIGIVR